jgi:hypothetical protein
MRWGAAARGSEARPAAPGAPQRTKREERERGMPRIATPAAASLHRNALAIALAARSRARTKLSRREVRKAEFVAKRPAERAECKELHRATQRIQRGTVLARQPNSRIRVQPRSAGRRRHVNKIGRF